MNKKIKIIDLAINIANKEWNKVPSRISFEGDDFIFDIEEKKYKQVNADYIYLCFPTYKLNEYVEILEDNTEEIKEITLGDLANIDGMANNRIMNKINELIKRINYIERKINDK